MISEQSIRYQGPGYTVVLMGLSTAPPLFFNLPPPTKVQKHLVSHLGDIALTLQFSPSHFQSHSFHHTSVSELLLRLDPENTDGDWSPPLSGAETSDFKGTRSTPTKNRTHVNLAAANNLD